MSASIASSENADALANLPQNFGIIRQDTSMSILQAIPLPPLPDDYILVETAAIALNPTDHTTLAAPGAPGSLVGCDYAGTVLAIGSAVTKPFKVGDRVCGFGHGGNDMKLWTGAFARFIAVKGDLQVKIPETISWEEACTAGVGIATAGWALWKELGLKMPDASGNTSVKDDGTTEWVLVYGGSSASGSIAIQFAKLSGYKVVTTASPKNFKLLEDRGADLVLDYRSPNVGAHIKHHTDGRLHHILDCAALPATAAICAEAFSAEGGVYCSLLPEACPRSDVKSIFFLGYSLSGEDYIFESDFYAAEPESYAFAKQYLPLVEKLWWQGRWKTHPARIGAGGLRGVFAGMQEMEEGKVSGEKLVYRVGDTEWPAEE